MVDGSRVNPLRRVLARRYGAAVPELSAGLPGIPGLPWVSRCLIARSWPNWPQEAGCHAGVGDSAVALRSPEGTLVA